MSSRSHHSPSPLRRLARRARHARRFAQRPWREQLLVLRAGALLIVLRFALVVLDFGTVRSLARRFAHPRRGRRPDAARAQQLVWAVWRASELIPTGRNCLLRSLAVHHLLGREGLASTLRIGVRTDAADGFSAHAWVEVDGRVITREGRGIEGWSAFGECVLGGS